VVLLKNDFLLRKDEYQRITRRESIVKYIPDVYYNFNNYSCFENDYRRTVDLKLRVPPGTLILDGEGYIRLKYPSYHGYFYGNKVRYDYTDAKDIFITTTIEHCPVCDKYLIGGYSAVTDTLRSIHTNNLVIILPGTLSSYKPNKGVVVDSYTNFDEDTEVIADFSYNKGKFMFTYVNINENKIYKTVWHRNIVIPNNDMLSEAFTITKIKGMDFISFTNAARRALKRLNRGKIESMMLWHHGKTFKKSNLELKYVGLVTLQTQEPYVYAEFEYGDAIYTYHLTAEEVTKCKNENDVARFILKNILNKIKIEKRKIKMVEKVKELSEKDDSELLEIISKIPKFTITDSLTVGNCEFGTRKWAEEIGLTYEKSSITGQELAKILSQHPDHLKDKEFLKVLAYKLVWEEILTLVLFFLFSRNKLLMWVKQL